jgi:hypothetical protein
MTHPSPSEISRARAFAVLVGLALLLAGCGNAPTGVTYKGALWLSWTIQGQSASDAACAAIDHVVITVESSPSIGVAIEPVRCIDGLSWERDDVPPGSDTVLVDAVDPIGNTTFEGISMIGVTEARAAAPAVVDLQPLSQ